MNSVSKSWKSLSNIWKRMSFPLVNSLYIEWRQIQGGVKLHFVSMSCNSTKSKTMYASRAQTQLRLNQWNNSCWLQESGVRVGHSGKSIVSLTGRGFCFIPETETFLVWHLVLATNTVQIYQTQQIKDTTKSTALKTQVTKIIKTKYFEYELIPKIQKNSGKSLLVLIKPLKYILVGLTL